jgi:hypothetical protein
MARNAGESGYSKRAWPGIGLGEGMGAPKMGLPPQVRAPMAAFIAAMTAEASPQSTGAVTAVTGVGAGSPGQQTRKLAENDSNVPPWPWQKPMAIWAEAGTTTVRLASRVADKSKK